MSDKSSYYGGYSLHRGNQAGGAPAAQPAMRSVPTFNNDWMMAGNHPTVAPPRGGAAAAMLPMLRNFFMPVPMYNAQPAPQPTAAAPAASHHNNNGNFYKGAPLTRSGPQQQPHNDHHHHQKSSHQADNNRSNTHHKQQQQQQQPKARPVSKVLRQASSDTWGAFDGIAPLQQSSDRHVDPIGTPMPRSVWAGTPADTKNSSSSKTAFSTWGGANNSMWKPPSLQKWVANAFDPDTDDIDPALLDKATKQSMLSWATTAANNSDDVSATTEDSTIQAMLQALTAAEPAKAAPQPICDSPATMAMKGADSDDEWFDHFQESVDRAMRQPSLDVAALVPSAKSKAVDMEWAQVSQTF